MEDMIFGTGPYAVSQPVTRTEDPRLLRGGGAYTDDKNLAGQAYAVFVAFADRPWNGRKC